MERKQAAVLISDIRGAADAKRIRACRRVVGDAIAAQGGELHPVGDTILAIFPTADALVMAGTHAHSAFSVNALAAVAGGASVDATLRIHSGAAFGTVSTDDSGEVSGDVLKLAGKVRDLAGPDQLFVTKTLANRLSSAKFVEMRPVGSLSVRGKAGELEILEVMWANEGLTARASTKPATEDSWVEVRFGDQVARLAYDKLKLTIGRDTTNDVVVTDRAVSREHAEVLHRRGRCYLVDRSTNGTYLRPGRRKPQHLHREELMLEGDGTFSLGRADGPPVSYRVL